MTFTVIVSTNFLEQLLLINQHKHNYAIKDCGYQCKNTILKEFFSREAPTHRGLRLQNCCLTHIICKTPHHISRLEPPTAQRLLLNMCEYLSFTYGYRKPVYFLYENIEKFKIQHYCIY